MYIANVAEDGFEDNPHLDAVRVRATEESAGVVVICNKLESEIIELDEEEKIDFLGEMGMEEPGLNRVIRAGYELLNLQTYFTAGPKEVRAWTVRVAPPRRGGRCSDSYRLQEGLYSCRGDWLRGLRCPSW